MMLSNQTPQQPATPAALPDKQARTKRAKLISGAIMSAGLVAWILGHGAGAPDIVPILGTLAFFGGFFGFVVARFRES